MAEPGGGRAGPTFEGFFERCTDLLCVVDDSGSIERVNPAFARAFGRDRADFASHSLLDVTHDDDRRSTRDHLRTLAADPEATLLYVTLGNQFARQGRWAEARQAYVRALAGDPENPDITFNLAVSLDRLHQPALAIGYYERALALAEHHAAGFQPEAARLRLQQLAR